MKDISISTQYESMLQLQDTSIAAEKGRINGESNFPIKTANMMKSAERFWNTKRERSFDTIISIIEGPSLPTAISKVKKNVFKRLF